MKFITTYHTVIYTLIVIFELWRQPHHYVVQSKEGVQHVFSVS